MSSHSHSVIGSRSCLLPIFTTPGSITDCSITGSVRPAQALKDPSIVLPGSLIVVLGGPAMLIGLGGGAASSQTSAEGSAASDYASVQRGNAEVQRRAQEVINACVSMGSENPILFIHGKWTSTAVVVIWVMPNILYLEAQI